MRRSGWTKWLIVIPAMLGIVLVTYVRYTTDIWGFGAFICQLIAILELAYGLRIAMLAQNRKKSYRLTPEERHEYARYLYEKQYHRYPAVANQMLLVMARMSVLLNNYERAAQELADIRIDKFNPAQLKLYYYLKVVTAMAAGDATGIQEYSLVFNSLLNEHPHRVPFGSENAFIPESSLIPDGPSSQHTDGILCAIKLGDTPANADAVPAVTIWHHQLNHSYIPF